MRETICSGLISTRSFQTGFLSILPHRSQNALTIAANARFITPLSGPIHRS
uniref:Uncharacterized protein n=1 Tax=Lepeophtheirus salmonis TaxID=72036 RepID=A0A0K2U9G0_LEPSM